MRTPPRTSSSSGNAASPTSGLVKQSSLSSFFDPVNKKRSKPDIADDVDDVAPADASDPLRLLMSMMEKNHAEISTKMDSNHNDVTSKISAIGVNFEVLEATVAKATSDISAIQRKMDEIDQDKLDSHMVINGTVTSQVDASKNDMKQFAIDLIHSFQISLEASDVDQAYAFPVATIKRRIVVVFRSSAVKSRVMAAKRASTDERSLYFDHRVTAANGELLRQLRQLAKTDGGRAFLYGGRVYYQKPPNTRIRVNSFEDINKLKTPSQ